MGWEKQYIALFKQLGISISSTQEDLTLRTIKAVIESLPNPWLQARESTGTNEFSSYIFELLKETPLIIENRERFIYPPESGVENKAFYTLLQKEIFSKLEGDNAKDYINFLITNNQMNLSR